MPIMKAGYVYYNRDTKKNNYIQMIVPVEDIVVSDKVFREFKEKNKGVVGYEEG